MPENLIISLIFLKLDINKRNDRLRKFTKNNLMLKITDKICLKSETEMSPKKLDEIWALILLSLKFRRPVFDCYIHLVGLLVLNNSHFFHQLAAS